jgi:2,5-diamino-6-(ribosylamino)-4(3H)-pyrimidinone 5'-phosphate reductase
MKPRVVIYNAVSLDGRIDWFTADLGVFYEQIGRFHEGATLAGCDTLLNPPEEVPPESHDDLEPPNFSPYDKRPLLVVADSRGRLRNWHYWRRQPYWKDHLALCSETTPKEYLDYLDERSIHYYIAGTDHVDYGSALEWLNAEFEVKAVRVESGGTLNGALLRAGLVDEVALLVHPSLVGGSTPHSFFRASDLESPDGVIELKLQKMKKLKNDILLLIYEVT